ncbi:FYVE zinc finger domain-containing protein [Sorangium sp. So ce118]
MYDDILKDNSEALWDWITWETLGNPSEKFQKGNELREFGLWRAEYSKLCSSGRDESALGSAHADTAKELGRADIRICVLTTCDYREHEALIKTLLPFMGIDKRNGQLLDPHSPSRATLKTAPYYVLFPYNYDDNAFNSRALGTNLRGPRGNLKSLEKMYDATRLVSTLPRWSTASRSCISVFSTDGIDADEAYTYKTRERDDWPFRNSKNEREKIYGATLGTGDTTHQDTTYSAVQSKKNSKTKFYSVKTGVQYVGTEEQKVNNKDLLEANSVHAMHRSELISRTIQQYSQAALEARYQIEILTVLIKGQYADWDGYQIRDIGDSDGEIWFPLLALPSQGRAFAKQWGGDDDWVGFWGRNFARPLGRAKAEMLVYFGLQHMTANAQNMLVAFDRARGRKAKCVILRDVGDTLYNDHFFAALQGARSYYKAAWDEEVGDPLGVTLSSEIGGGYEDPYMTRIATIPIFFFPPFMGGDIGSSGKPAKILAAWAIQHNRAFIEYMRDKIGYTADWQGDWKSGSNESLTDIGAAVRESPGFDKRTQDRYKTLYRQINALEARQRWKLIREIEAECLTVGDTDTAKAKLLASAHDLLLSSEVEGYVKSDAGKKRLADYHEDHPSLIDLGGGTQRGSRSVNTGLGCSMCGKKHGAKESTFLGNWHQCTTCSRAYCNTCGKWWLSRAVLFERTRVCEFCGGKTELIG